jgi:protocatechuate 4,5-dioxygenase, alpha chain
VCWSVGVAGRAQPVLSAPGWTAAQTAMSEGELGTNHIVSYDHRNRFGCVRRSDPIMLPAPPLELGEPGTFVFGVEEAARGRALNRFAASLRDPGRRAAFAADETGVLRDAGLGEEVIDMVLARDWTGLMRAGGHLQVLLLVAHALGLTLWDLGAHNVGCEPSELIASCPRQVQGLPVGMQAAPWRG